MSESNVSWPRRFVRWLFGGPFRQLPPQYGNTVPPDLQQFEEEAANAGRQGFGDVAHGAPVHHAKTQPARPDGSLERR
ncbi:MAG: hypothetical protein BWY52_01282 [Chloroflexi bacterium ADurb.Bin325]|nr:MAG: hypothetical protein BWY52_01282 [Chloroflexi bacterium ADurb.Bin325]